MKRAREAADAPPLSEWLLQLDPAALAAECAHVGLALKLAAHLEHCVRALRAQVELPDVVCSGAAGWLPGPDLGRCASVSRQWRGAGHEDAWRWVAEERWPGTAVVAAAGAVRSFKAYYAERACQELPRPEAGADDFGVLVELSAAGGPLLRSCGALSLRDPSMDSTTDQHAVDVHLDRDVCELRAKKLDLTGLEDADGYLLFNDIHLFNGGGTEITYDHLTLSVLLVHKRAGRCLELVRGKPCTTRATLRTSLPFCDRDGDLLTFNVDELGCLPGLDASFKIAVTPAGPYDSSDSCAMRVTKCNFTISAFPLLATVRATRRNCDCSAQCFFKVVDSVLQHRS